MGEGVHLRSSQVEVGAAEVPLTYQEGVGVAEVLLREEVVAVAEVVPGLRLAVEAGVVRPLPEEVGVGAELALMMCHHRRRSVGFPGSASDTRTGGRRPYF